MKTKICYKCHKRKKVIEFYKNKFTKDGYNVWCKKCMKKYLKKYRQKNKNKLKLEKRKYDKIYRKTHKHKIKEDKKIYYEKNKIKILKQQKLHCQNLKSWIKTYFSILARCNCKSNVSYKYYGNRKVKCLITPKELKYLWFRDKAYLMKKPSIDRINTNGNYELKNCRYIEFIENCSRKKRIKRK